MDDGWKTKQKPKPKPKPKPKEGSGDGCQAAEKDIQDGVVVLVTCRVLLLLFRYNNNNFLVIPTSRI